MSLISRTGWTTLRARGTAPLASACAYKWLTKKRLPDRVLSHPRFIQIETTNACNLRCAMCTHSVEWSRKTWKQRTMTQNEFERIIAEIPGTCHVELNGRGEPLLDPHLLDRIAYANRKALTTAFFTNATLMTPELSRRLVNAPGLAEIRISIDTADPEAYAALRVGARLDAVLGNLEALVRIRRETGGALPAVTVSMTAMPDYVRDIPKLVEALKRAGLDALHIKDVAGIEAILPNERLSPEDSALILDFQQSYAKRGFLISYLRATPRNRVETRTCVAPWETFFVNAGGDVHPCCFTPFPDMVFGNILETPFRRIWNNDAYRSFRHELKTAIPKHCATCPAHGQTWVHPPAM